MFYTLESSISTLVGRAWECMGPHPTGVVADAVFDYIIIVLGLVILQNIILYNCFIYSGQMN